jgi:hypothetical protein
MRFFLLLTVLIFGPITGFAEEKTSALLGSGSSSCGAWGAHIRQYNPGGSITPGSLSSLQESAWVVGFLSGVGFMGQGRADPLDGMDYDGVIAWVNNYCQGHPIENIAQAAAAFYYAHPHR